MRSTFIRRVCKLFLPQQRRQIASRLTFEPLETRRVFAWFDDLSSELGGVETATTTRYLSADFTTDSAATALTAVLKLSKAATTSTAIVELYSDDATGLEPGTKLGTFTQVDQITTSLTSVSFTLQGVSLQAATDYWIVLRATTGSIDWGWTSDFAIQNDWGNSDDSGTTWFTTDVYPPQYSVSSGVTATVPQVTLTGATVDESAGTAQFVVTLSAVSSQPVIVTYQTTDGTAVAGQDYQSASGSLTIPAGSTTGVINVAIIDDATDESNETFTLQLTTVSNASLSTSSAVGTIVNDDSPHKWQYQRNPLDVNADGSVTALDALLIINRINNSGTGRLPDPSATFQPPPYFDCSGDDNVSPLDALLVINQINIQAAGEYYYAFYAPVVNSWTKE